ncbi:hypothetical protein [Olleya sp. R77988]|uniref:hypothetical protein n=1 Tax=Olleya sp. R77988 TaxID=3093875 RepID=UPI0037CA44E3
MRYFTLIFIFFISLSSFSQEDIKKSPISSIDNNEYFHNYQIENFYLHTNKNIYFTEESIFFKAYVVSEANNHPNLQTTNLHINLYDFDNKLVLSHLFYVEKGKSHGSIKLPKDLKSGQYTLQLNTQWNRNFKEGSNFSIQIQNLKDSNTTLTTTNTILNEVDNENKKQLTSKKTDFILLESNSKKADVVNFKLRTSKETIEKKENKFVYAALHKNGFVSTTAPFNLSKNVLTYNLNFFKTDLFDGLNTISIFDTDNKLLAEKSFNYKAEKQVDILAKKVNQTKDSLTLDLNLINVYKEANVSISVLHKDSKVIDYSSNIITTLCNQNDVKRFPYQSISKKTLLFDNEKGLKLKGYINTPIENPADHKVMFFTNSNNTILTYQLSSDKNFEFKNLSVAHPSDYVLTLMDKKGEPKDGQFYIYNISTSYIPDSILKMSKVKTVLETEIDNTKTVTKKLKNIELPISKDIELLDEIVLKNIENKKAEQIKKIKKENPFLGINAGHSREYLIDPEKDFITLEQYLRTKISGLRVVYDGPRVYVYNIRRSGLNLEPSLIGISLDGINIGQNGGLINPNQSVADFELISVNLSGLGNGIRAENGIIHLISRKGSNLKTNNISKSKTYKTTNGYNINQETLEDSNLFYPNKTSENSFSTIDWIPNVNLDPNKSNIVKIKKSENQNVKLIINGISDDGDLIYKIIDL